MGAVIVDDFSNWMAHLPQHLHTVPLSRLAIPGGIVFLVLND